MRKPKLIAIICSIGIFFIGYYHEQVNNYFDTINTIIGLLFLIILLLSFWIMKLREQKNQSNNSYHYCDGQNTILNKQIREKDEIINFQKNKIESFEYKMEDLHKKYMEQITELNNKIYNLKTNKDE